VRMAAGPLGWLLYMEGCCVQPAKGSQKGSSRQVTEGSRKAAQDRLRMAALGSFKAGSQNDSYSQLQAGVC
jgi:hypothetical protein